LSCGLTQTSITYSGGLVPGGGVGSGWRGRFMAAVSCRWPGVVPMVVLCAGRQRVQATIAVPTAREAPAGGWPQPGWRGQERAAAVAGLADLAAQAGGR
jgi:hypothetical protein